MHIEVVDFREALTVGGCRLQSSSWRAASRCRSPPTVPEWLPKLSGRKLFQEFYVAADAEGSVRGGYLLKYQEFRIGDQTLSIGDFQLPVSEGFVNRAYMPLARLLRNAERRMPLLYSLGMGPLSEPLPRLLAASGWRVTPVPFFFRIVHPVPFLRNSVYLRRNVLLRRLLDVLAFFGLGLGGRQARLRRRRAGPPPGANHQRRDRRRV